MERTLYRITFEFRPYGAFADEWQTWHMHLWCVSAEEARGYGEATAREYEHYGHTRNVTAEEVRR